MPEYKNLDGDVVDMDSALTLTSFVLTWVDAEVECGRRAGDSVWGLRRRMRGGIVVPLGSVTRLQSLAFVRSGSRSHEYNTFDEAAREQIKPI